MGEPLEDELDEELELEDELDEELEELELDDDEELDELEDVAPGFWLPPHAARSIDAIKTAAPLKPR